MDRAWANRERQTAKLIRAVIGVLGLESLSAAQLHALCRLTWITTSNGEVADNTRAVVAPALSELLSVPLRATSLPELADDMHAHDVPEVIVQAAAKPVGMVNFYSAFRRTSLDWIKEHLTQLSSIVLDAIDASSDSKILNVYERVSELPSLPRRNAGSLPAHNLMTPLLACLDRRGRAPIINARDMVAEKLKLLGLSRSTLVEQCEGLMKLIGQGGISDAFALDTAALDDLKTAFVARRPRSRPTPTRPEMARELGQRDDDDLEYLRGSDHGVQRRLHNRMTNALRVICKKLDLTVQEGTDPECMFDAKIDAYKENERSLLIEVKTDPSPPFVRLAVGQLFDYRRQLPDRAATDVAVLLPQRPPARVLEFLHDVGVSAIWFSADFRSISGDVPLRG